MALSGKRMYMLSQMSEVRHIEMHNFNFMKHRSERQDTDMTVTYRIGKYLRFVNPIDHSIDKYISCKCSKFYDNFLLNRACQRSFTILHF